ncbi:MAG: M28 family metallopeptidase [Actinomycetota bacterium]
MHHLRVLSVDIGPRPAGSEGEERTEEYLAMILEDAGLEVIRMPFTMPGGGTSFNVIGRVQGAGYSNGYLIVGGHYDTVGGSPGANDNASGAAVVLTLAEEFAERAVPVEFIGFGAEEQQPGTSGPQGHHIGSSAYVAGLGSASGPLAGMVSVDMVAAGPRVLVLRLRGTADALQTELGGVADTAEIPATRQDAGDISDHGPFAQAGVAAAFLWSGPHQTHHEPTDVFEVAQPDAVARTGNLLLAWLKMRFGIE